MPGYNVPDDWGSHYLPCGCHASLSEVCAEHAEDEEEQPVQDDAEAVKEILVRACDELWWALDDNLPSARAYSIKRATRMVEDALGMLRKLMQETQEISSE